MVKIFLTGSTGFVGSHFLNAAHDAGYAVVALRQTASVRPRVALSTQPTWLTKPLNAVTPADMNGCAALVHLAAAGVSPQKASWREMNECNVLSLFHLCEVALKAAVPRLVLAGSIAEYGLSANDHEFIPPDAALRPTFPYSASKAAGFMLAHGLAVEWGAELYYGRIAAAYGEGQHQKNIWPSLRHAALAGADFEMTPGEQVRDFIRVDRVAAIFLDALDRRDVRPGRPVVENVGSGVPVVLAEWAQHWWRHFGAKGKLRVGALLYRENEVMRYVPAVTARIRRLATVADETAAMPPASGRS